MEIEERNEDDGLGPGMRLVRDGEENVPLKLVDNYTVQFDRMHPNSKTVPSALTDEMSNIVEELKEALRYDTNERFLEKAACLLELLYELVKRRGNAFGDIEIQRRRLIEERGGFKLAVIRQITKNREEGD